MQLIVYTIILLGILGFVGALVLYFTAKRFSVHEDPRIDSVCAELAGANCGGCGFKGCRDFATACVEKGSLEGLNCPVSGPDGMARVAKILGVEPVKTDRRIAVLRCDGNCTARPQIFLYDGAKSCRVMNAVGTGTSGCAYGCLGCGDCTQVCQFGAISMDPATGLPVVDADKCTACGACVAECPRNLLELRPLGRRERRVWVACANRDRGAVARKFCSSACIGCGKCQKTCSFGAISIADNLAYINPDVCKTCGLCVSQCPTGAIHASFTPPAKTEKTVKEVAQ